MHEDEDSAVEHVAGVQLDETRTEDVNEMSDDDFGDFNDDTVAAREEDTPVEEPSSTPSSTPSTSTRESENTKAQQDAPRVSDMGPGQALPSRAVSNGPKPLKISTLARLSAEEIQNTLTKPPVVPGSELAQKYNDELGDGTTPTSQTLWQHLTEPTWMPLPKWEGSPIHRQLVVNLGIPLNLDASLPKPASAVKGNLHLPTQNASNGADGLQNIPEWELFAEVSLEALQRMSEPELEAHLTKLQSVLDESMQLKDAMESKEMDLVGEKHILEGMVESLLMFSQRKQRERLQRKVSKSRR